MLNAAMNPSDFMEVKNVRAPASLTAAKTYNLTTGVDVSVYEYVMVLADLGATVGTTTVTLQESDTAAVSGGGYAAITGKTMTFASTADQNMKAIECRTHGLKQYLNVNLVQSTGSATIGLTLLGFGRQYSANLTTFSGSLATLGMSVG